MYLGKNKPKKNIGGNIYEKNIEVNYFVLTTGDGNYVYRHYNLVEDTLEIYTTTCLESANIFPTLEDARKWKEAIDKGSIVLEGRHEEPPTPVVFDWYGYDKLNTSFSILTVKGTLEVSGII